MRPAIIYQQSRVHHTGLGYWRRGTNEQGISLHSSTVPSYYVPCSDHLCMRWCLFVCTICHWICFLYLIEVENFNDKFRSLNAVKINCTNGVSSANKHQAAYPSGYLVRSLSTKLTLLSVFANRTYKVCIKWRGDLWLVLLKMYLGKFLGRGIAGVSSCTRNLSIAVRDGKYNTNKIWTGIMDEETSW